ncbi:hypothetical protein [Marinobacter salicampi]|uniref:hypothetical protein n=1 Tax=Marinobacter salicampi TaxID=435907 RepID=UPI00140AAAD8|nr:hypothetical protein [Marinobacter salicampi]
MRNIYNLAGPFGCRFETAVFFSDMEKTLPGLQHIEIEMAKPCAGDVIDVAHQRAETAAVFFENGDSLELAGPYLWKFLDSVPHNLLNESGTDYADSRCGGIHVRDLVNVLRRLYGAMIRPNNMIEESNEADLIESIKIDGQGRVSTKLAPKISEDDVKEIAALIKDYFDLNRSELLTEISDWITGIVSEPFLEQSFVREGKHLRPVFEPVEWGDELRSITWDEFTTKLTSRTGENSPAYLHVFDCWLAQNESMVEKALQSVMNNHRDNPSVQALSELIIESGHHVTQVHGTSTFFNVFSEAAACLGEIALRSNRTSIN